MKLQKIGKVCKRQQQLILITDEARQMQYIRAGRCTYVLEGMPRMFLGGMKTVFDITAKQEDDMLIEEQAAPAMAVCMEDTVTDEEMITDEGLAVSFLGQELMPLKMPDGAWRFFDTGYFAPMVGAERIDLFARKTRGGVWYVTAKQGLLAKLAILPEDPDARLEGLIRRISEDGIR